MRGEISASCTSTHDDTSSTMHPKTAAVGSALSNEKSLAAHGHDPASTLAEHQKMLHISDTPILWTARYSLASSYADTSGEGIVMSSCKKEWLDKLNLPKRDVVKGQVQAVGELRTSDQGVARKLMVVEPKLHSVPVIHPLLRVSMCELAAPPGPKSSHSRAMPLGRPCFSPFEPGDSDAVLG